MERITASTNAEETPKPPRSNDSDNGLTLDIVDLVHEWTPLLGLDDWEILIKFDEQAALGTSVAEPRYHKLTLNFNLRRITDEEPDLEELIVHEMCHAYSWRIWTFAEKLVGQYVASSEHGPFVWMLEEMHEELTTQIGFALMRVKGLVNGKTS